MNSKTLIRVALAAVAIVTIQAGAIALGSARAQAQDYREMSCSELWYARNQIYAGKRYCFETDRARAEFGRACFPPYGRLSRWDREEVERIERREGRRGCN
jgi:hypothetical protein